MACPKLPLGAASARGSGEGGEDFCLSPLLLLLSDRALARAPISMGSPRGVPVPCIATRERQRTGIEEEEEEDDDDDDCGSSSEKETDASRSAEDTAAVCAGPDGAVSPDGVPACRTLEPKMKPRGGGAEEEEEEEEGDEEAFPLLDFLCRRSNSAATPSPLPYPSASESKGLHLPEGDKACSWQIPAKVAGRSMR